MINILRKEVFNVKDRKNDFIDEKYDIHTMILLNNIGKPKYVFVDGDKEKKVCRFCGKSEDDVHFENKSHVIPKFLGNFFVLSNFECDECNSFFSKYETELEKYIKIPLIINNKDKTLKDRSGKNISRIGDEIIVNEKNKQEKVEFNGLYVLKIMLKFAYSMLNEDEIGEYKKIKDVLISDKIPINNHILDITKREPFELNNVVLYEKKKETDLCDNILVINYNMKKYIIFFNKDKNNKKVNNILINEEYIKLFNDIDIYRYRVRNFKYENQQIKFNIDVFMDLFIKNKI